MLFTHIVSLNLPKGVNYATPHCCHRQKENVSCGEQKAIQGPAVTMPDWGGVEQWHSLELGL
jgi:hypothetical protein